jgi:ATP adenylyltransferase/5',5'''-P-1,P-4-tetraphosphate phosphorylase II
MGNTHLVFDRNIGIKKPESILNRETKCPFCDVQNLTGILDQEDSIILLKNKYPVLQDAFQTVIIETDKCDSELSGYDKKHLHKLFRFAVRNWMKMQEDTSFRSCLLFKNHGPLSGGTIFHPHMQIIGLKDIDYCEDLLWSHFEGIEVFREQGVILNLSTKPKVGFFEFNVIIDQLAHLDDMADLAQTTVKFILNDFSTRKCNSYNLFFYQFHSKFLLKIIPRFVTSPLYIGYLIPQVANNLEEVTRNMQRLYF